MDIPKICQLHSDQCGNYYSNRNKIAYGDPMLSKVKDLIEDVGPIFGADIVLTERDLIGLRSDQLLNDDGWICTHHKYKLGKGFRPSKNCKYFEHANSTAKGSKVRWELYKFVKATDPEFILGSMICSRCQIKLNQRIRDADEADLMDCDDDSDADPTFVMETVDVDSDEKLLKRDQLDNLNNALGVERVRFQVNSNIQDMSESSLNYFRHMHTVMQNSLTDKFCCLVAPGQEDEMKSILLTTKETEIDPIVKHLKNAFDTCLTRSARCAVLSLIPKTYSKAKVADLFECSLYEVAKARSVNKLYGACGSQPTTERVYSRLSIEKARHFIDFLFSAGLLQEVAYGTTQLRFECGDKVTVSNTILNGINEHAVKEYIIHCNEINIERLGRSTLLKMLDNMKPRNRQKLAGIDSFLVDGIEGYETLRVTAKLLGENVDTKELLKRIDQSELYLKARYKTHCKNNDSCLSHCIDHALSHPKDKHFISECSQVHDRNCAECANVIDSIALLQLMIKKLPPSHTREVAEWEIQNAAQKIMHWQRHIIRGVQQSEARAESFKKLGPTHALWIRDYAQKYLPTKTLEAMTDYFGKRGMTVSVEVFFTKVFMSYHKQVYLVAVQKSDQGTVDTLCIADAVLEQFCKDSPHIESADVKSDNAANYHANGVAECMHKLAKQRGINLLSYDFNEAQLGKDQCDREAAIFKKCAERWLTKKETNKISTPIDLLNAVFSDGDPKNTKMCVLEIDKSISQFSGVSKISNISYYHSMEFQPNGILYREYFNIGNGKFEGYDDLTFVRGASLVHDWKISTVLGTAMTYDSRNEHRKYRCSELFCVSEFKTENDLIQHIESEVHQFPTIKTGMDKAISYYVQQKEVHHINEEVASPQYSETEMISSNIRTVYLRGWARKVRNAGKISSKQKTFVEHLFHHGAQSKSKLSAEQMAEKMKNHVVNGNYYFRPDEYLKVTQIRGLISRFNKKKPVENPVFVPEDDGIDENFDEICSIIFDDVDDSGDDFEGFESSDV